MRAIRRMRRAVAARATDRAEAWRSVAEEVGGEYLPGKKRGREEVHVERGPWRIVLDTHVVHTGHTAVTYTRVRAYYTGRRELTVTVRRRNVFDRLFQALGWTSVPPLGRALVERYVVKGRPRARVPSLFSSGLTDAILSVPSLRLEVKRPSRKSRRRWGEDAGVVVCRTSGVITDPPRLVGMVRVVEEALEGLARIGEARREAAAAKLR